MRAMHRVLIVSHFFPPHGGGGVHRALAWARHLPSFGWNVTILAAGRSGYHLRDESLLERIPEGTEILRVDAWSRVAPLRGRAPGSGGDGTLRSLARMLLVPDSYRAWGTPATRAGRKRIAQGGIDAVISTSPPETAHLVGESLSRRGHVPWIADFRDPWVGLHYREPASPVHEWLHRSMERRVLERADRVLCASRAHEQQVLKALGPLAGERVAFLPNGVETDPAPPVTIRAGDRARIVATGQLMEMPALVSFLDALARRIASHPRLAAQIEVVLAGPHDAQLPERIRAKRLERVVSLPGVLPHAEARALQRSAAALLFARNEGPGYGPMVPGKLYEYLDARRPLVAMVGGGDAAELAREGGAAVFGPGEGDAALDAALLAALGEPGAPIPDLPAIEQLLAGRTRRGLAAELAAILDRVIQPSKV
jgi:glycosyltransferase involved in cell wall biosynthesis